MAPEPGLWHPERFVSVTEDGLLFSQLREQVTRIEAAYRDIGQLRDPRRRLPGFHDEVWGHAAVHVNQAYESHRVREHAFPLGSVEEHPPRASRRDARPGGVLVERFEVLGVGGLS